jgi:hypothetical protein
MFNETKVLFPRASVTSADVGSSVIKLFVLPAPVIIYTIKGFHASYDLIFFSCDHDFKILK